MKTTDTIEDDVPEGLPVRHIEACLEHLRAARYAQRTLNDKRQILVSFRQACRKWLFVPANVRCVLQPMRNAANERDQAESGRAGWRRDL